MYSATVHIMIYFYLGYTMIFSYTISFHIIFMYHKIYCPPCNFSLAITEFSANLLSAHRQCRNRLWTGFDSWSMVCQTLLQSLLQC